MGSNEYIHFHRALPAAVVVVVKSLVFIKRRRSSLLATRAARQRLRSKMLRNKKAKAKAKAATREAAKHAPWWLPGAISEMQASLGVSRLFLLVVWFRFLCFALIRSIFSSLRTAIKKARNERLKKSILTSKSQKPLTHSAAAAAAAAAAASAVLPAAATFEWSSLTLVYMPRRFHS